MDFAKSSDAYFSADVETDGPIPGPFSLLSFGLVYAGSYDGRQFSRPKTYDDGFYIELKPISETYEEEALRVNGLDRARLKEQGADPVFAMNLAAQWILSRANGAQPILVAYPVSFDWTWLYWYFIQFGVQSPFSHSKCFDLKTAFAIKSSLPICRAGRSAIPAHLAGSHSHTHNALDDAIEQAQIFANVFEWVGQ